MLRDKSLLEDSDLVEDLGEKTAAAYCGGADEYGAIAYSPSTGAAGWSFDYATRGAAENRALRECERFSGQGDCLVKVWVRNAWASLARATNRAYGWAWNTNRSLAERNALVECSRRGLGCNIVKTIQA